jgi:phospholipase/lecithinase/hemolysin
MIDRARILVFVLVSFLLATAAGAAPFTGIVAFGDSLSDTGNLCPSPFCPSAPNEPGRFSNGPIWLDDLAAGTGLSSQAAAAGGTNFATGGATTVDVLNTQVPTFSASVGGAADPNALYVIWAGGNDGLGALSPVAAAQNVGLAIQNLAAIGAQSFLISNLPDLSLTPGNLGDPNAALFTTFFNSTLDSVLGGIGGLNIFEMDAFAATNDIVANPASYGLTNIDTACYDGVTVCGAPEDHAWWDNIHPTTEAHSIIGDLALATIPEPGTGLLVSLGLTGLALGRRRAAA